MPYKVLIIKAHHNFTLLSPYPCSYPCSPCSANRFSDNIAGPSHLCHLPLTLTKEACLGFYLEKWHQGYSLIKVKKAIHLSRLFNQPLIIHLPNIFHHPSSNALQRENICQEYQFSGPQTSNLDIAEASGLPLKKISIASKFLRHRKNYFKACQQEPKLGFS